MVSPVIWPSATFTLLSETVRLLFRIGTISRIMCPLYPPPHLPQVTGHKFSCRALCPTTVYCLPHTTSVHVLKLDVSIHNLSTHLAVVCVLDCLFCNMLNWCPSDNCLTSPRCATLCPQTPHNVNSLPLTVSLKPPERSTVMILSSKLNKSSHDAWR